MTSKRKGNRGASAERDGGVDSHATGERGASDATTTDQFSKREGAPSLLDNSRITRPSLPDRREWLRGVEKRTEAHRIRKAQKHSRRARQIKEEKLDAGRPHQEAIDAARWHQRRAHGQIHRFEAVLDCGTEKYWLQCQTCGRVKERTRECRVALLCVRCRAAIGQEKRARFRLARRRALDRVRPEGLMHCGHRSWSEKLLTLTLPHLHIHSARERIDYAFRALFLLLKALKKWLRAGPDFKLVAWFRTVEWTPGGDGRGHPHFHFWLLCPYLDVTFLRRAWRQALETAGFPAATVENVVLDLRRVHDGEGAAREVIKYLTKDILPDRQFVDPDVFAVVYEALDDRRVTQPSSGFFRGIDARAACECGALGKFKRTTTRPESGADGSSYKDLEVLSSEPEED